MAGLDTVIKTKFTSCMKINNCLQSKYGCHENFKFQLRVMTCCTKLFADKIFCVCFVGVQCVCVVGVGVGSRVLSFVSRDEI